MSATVTAARRDAARQAGDLVAGAVAGFVAGVGVDVVDVARFRRILARRPGFAARFFTDAEQADARRSPDPSASLAARFAAKEAVMKALGTGLGGFALTEVEVRRAPGAGATGGAPSLVLHGAAAAVATRRRVGPLHLSLSHTADVAIAFVVAERCPPCAPS
jgi:holo-[acyl-carrier protein] synthase